MLATHIIIAGRLTQGNLISFWPYFYGALSQAGFLFASGYLMAYYFDPKKINKYLIRIVYFTAIYIIVNLITSENLISSNFILLNFAISTAISLIFLYFKRFDLLSLLALTLLGLTGLMQILNNYGINSLDKFLADYSYPVNSLSPYFFLGVILTRHQKELKSLFITNFPKYLVEGLFLGYIIIFSFGIKINIYGNYLHLPLMIAANAIILLWAFYNFENISLKPKFKKIIFYTSESLLYIYALHYLLFFGILKDYSAAWWEFLLWLVPIIPLAIGLKLLINKLRKK